MKKNKPPQHPVLRRSNFLVVITARGGSKGIPHKNIVKLAGRPLVEYSIRAARGSRYFRDFDLMCSTEDAKIARVAREGQKGNGSFNYFKRNKAKIGDYRF